MAKGSQLTQLKSALSSAGLTGQKPSSKKRKRTSAVPLEKDKEKKAARLEEIHRRLNPFDVKVTKLKHDVGGRKIKGVIGRPAQSKQSGIEQRKKTLLKEYQEKDRAGGIVDRRFGENDANMSLEEKMLERFTKERQRASKTAAFTLEDEDDLTHYGRSLATVDDFDSHVGFRDQSEDEDEEDLSGRIGRDIVSQTHFGGFSDNEEDGPPRKKSKAEVMAEVVAKSKEHKMRRQKEKEQADDIRHELDDNFASLRDLIFATPALPETSTGEDTTLPPEAVLVLAPASGIDPVTAQLTATHGEYDQHVRELAFEKRAKPKDRTKTEEEIAREEKEALEKAERSRLRRMRGEPESDDEDGMEGGRKAKRKMGADDLDDDFDEELGPWEGLGAGLGAQDEQSLEESESESEDEDEGEDESEGEVVDGSESEDDEDEDEDDSEEEDEEQGEHEQLVGTSRMAKSKSKTSKSKKHSLPFTFPCPETHEEFLDIVEDLDDEDVPTVVQRIRTLFHTSLAADNKFKLQTFGTVLIDHVLFVASSSSPPIPLINTLSRHIASITSAYPVPLARHFNEKLDLMHKNLKRGISKGPLLLESKTWPTFSELILLRLIGVIFPTSDMNHAVISPTRVLMGAYLGLCRVRSLSDLASGLFLCSLWLEHEAFSKRFVPEVMNFLVNAVLHLAPHKFGDVADLPGSFPAPDFKTEQTESLAMKTNAKAREGVVERKPVLTDLLLSKDATEQDKGDLLGMTLELLSRFSELYKGLDGFVELYEPILAVLENVSAKRLPVHLSTKLGAVIDTTARLLKFAKQDRKPLRLQAHKPIPIPTFIPKFETSSSSNYLRRQDPDHEKNQLDKLKAQYKQERKGAIRELRKDSRFLAAVQQKEQIEKDRQYKERMGRVFGSIEGERAEQKQMEKEKSRDKRRAGKK